MSADPLPYDAQIHLANRNDAHTLVYEQLLARLPAGARVLEVGCATGTLGAALRQAGLHVTGVEPMAAAAAVAAARLDEVFVGLADAYFEARPAARFDAIAFGDVLEHLAQPAAMLRLAQAHLAPGGCIVASVPNATHGSVRAMLLEGRWDMQLNGILDRTHLRFFSHRGLLALFSEAGLAVDYLAATVQRARDSNRQFGMGLQRRSIAWAELLATDGAVDVFQHIVVARPAGAAAAAANAPWLARPLLRPVPPTAPWRRRLRAAWDLLRAGVRPGSR